MLEWILCLEESFENYSDVATWWISSNHNKTGKTGDEEMESLECQAIKDEETEKNWQWASR